jgi:integrase
LLEVLLDTKYKVMHKPEVRVIYHIGMFTGQRMKDCVLLRWDRINLDMKRIWVKQFKTGKEVTIPIAPKLLEVFLEAKEWKTDEYVCPNVAARYKKVDANGKNTGNNLVNIDVLRVIRWIGLEPSVDVEGRKKKVTMYGFHSLRHSFASHCAVAGVPKAVVTSILGADSEIVDRYYTHIGNEAQEKAILAISGDVGGTKSDRERIEEAINFISTCRNNSAELKSLLEILSGQKASVHESKSE